MANRCVVQTVDGNYFSSDPEHVSISEAQEESVTTITVQIMRAQLTDTGHWDCTTKGVQANGPYVDISGKLHISEYVSKQSETNPTGRQAGRQTDRDRQTETDRQTESNT